MSLDSSCCSHLRSHIPVYNTQASIHHIDFCFIPQTLMNVTTTSMGAVSTSVSTFQGITAVLATMALCWLTMATTAWVRSVFRSSVSGDVNTAL